MMIVLASALVAMSLFLVVGGISLSLRNSETTVSERFNAYMAGMVTETVTFQELELSQPFSQRVLAPIFKRVISVFKWMWPQNRMAMLRQRIAMAGSRSNISASDFVGIKGLTMVVLLAFGFLVGYSTGYPLDYYSALMLMGLGVCGFFLPDFWLSSQISKRQLALTNSLPNALDMLTITIEAGLSFESALQEIVSKWNDELSREFARVLRDIGMGKARRQALSDFSDRTGVSDITSLVSALNQAEELGVSIGRVLQTQSEEMRVRRRQRAQESANQAPVKIMFPLVFLIFPALFAVLLGPSVPKMLKLFS